MGWSKVCCKVVIRPKLTSIFSVFRTSFEEAASIFNADEARSIEHFPSHLKSVLGFCSHVYIDFPRTYTRSGIRSAARSVLRNLSSPLPARSEYDSTVESLENSRRKPLAPEIARLRAIKSECEQRIMRKAADISSLSHAKVDGGNILVIYSQR